MKINNTDVSDEIIESVIDAVREKKTLIFMDKKFITFEISKFLSNHLTYIPKLSNKKSKEFEAVVKHVRSRCHDIYEIFQTREIEKRDEMLNLIKKLTKETVVPILFTHLSTKERLSDYESVYREIFKITKSPNSILDIGCGLNPVSIPYMDLDIKKIKYFASEISAEDTNFINNFFLKFGINGETFSCNIVKEYPMLSKYPSDVCFAFKLFDVLETQEEHVSYKIMSAIKCRYLAASFSMKNIKNERMKRTSVSYFERFLKNMGFLWSTFSTENELFYVVKMDTKTDAG